MPLSLTPLQQQKFVDTTLYNVQVGVGAAQMELNHLGLGMPTVERKHETFITRDLPFRHETARVAHEEIYLASGLLDGVVPALPLAKRGPGREALASLQVATRKLNDYLQTPDVEKEFGHGVDAYAAIVDAFKATQRLSALVAG